MGFRLCLAADVVTYTTSISACERARSCHQLLRAGILVAFLQHTSQQFFKFRTEHNAKNRRDRGQSSFLAPALDVLLRYDPGCSVSLGRSFAKNGYSDIFVQLAALCQWREQADRAAGGGTNVRHDAALERELNLGG